MVLEQRRHLDRHQVLELSHALTHQLGHEAACGESVAGQEALQDEDCHDDVIFSTAARNCALAAGGIAGAVRCQRSARPVSSGEVGGVAPEQSSDDHVCPAW
jgi:hypothetical protein